MSACIVDKKTIDVIVKGFQKYEVVFETDCGEALYATTSYECDKIGQALLNQNYASVNYRYGEENEAPEYIFEDIEIDEGLLLGCIDCYNCQACETEDYCESRIFYSLNDLKMWMLEGLIKEKGQEIPWGYREKMQI